MRVAILHNDDNRLRNGEPDDAIAVRSVITVADAVQAACEAIGWEPVRVTVNRDPREMLGRLDRADVVFNLAESVDGDPSLEPAVAWLLDWCAYAFTGSSGTALALALDKQITKAVLDAHGVATPRAAVLADRAAPLPALRYPAIVKPVRHDASHGIHTESIVADEREARERTGRIINRYAQPALVEEFVDGREFNVALLAESALPIREIVFSDPPILTYEAKWMPQSADYAATMPVFCEDLPPELRGRLLVAARTAWDALGLRGYARVDVRVDAAGHPFVLDVNPNPDLSPDAGFALAAAHAGISYAELIAALVEDALARAPAAASR